MKKKLCVAFSLLIFLFLLKNKVSFSEEISTSTFQWRKIENNAFYQGEKFLFDIYWGPIKVGFAEMRVEGLEELFYLTTPRTAYRIVSEASSYPFFDIIYKVRNCHMSWIDTESLCSLKYVGRQREGGYFKDETIMFDHPNKRFQLIEVNKEGTEKIVTGSIPAFVQDVLSAFYYVRTLDLKVGEEYCLDTQSGDKNYPLRVVVHKKEKIKVEAGSFKCFLVEPFVREDAGIFKAKGRVWIWLTADKHKIPVLMKSKIFVGYISAELKKK
ncbi:MAG: DUF3108 domain-containing protein [Elusimicrobiota bacterium]|nr:DUF3108 domain-containing protein [Elusimicrobiota bacterium]